MLHISFFLYVLVVEGEGDVQKVTDEWEIRDVKRTYRMKTKIPGQTAPKLQKTESLEATDELNELKITGEDEQLVDESTRLVGGPNDKDVKSEYLTHLSHMLMDDCRYCKDANITRGVCSTKLF